MNNEEMTEESHTELMIKNLKKEQQNDIKQIEHYRYALEKLEKLVIERTAVINAIEKMWSER